MLNPILSSPMTDTWGVLPYKGLMGMCGQSGYGFRDFCRISRVLILSLCLKQGIFFGKCLKRGMVLGKMS